MNDAMRTNVRRYPWFVATMSVSPWLPVFFLYFSEQVGFEDAVTLSAIYYLSVVVLEVPSGYLSDRAGRRPALLVATTALLLAYTGFALSSSFAAFAVCQMLLAAGIAFQSGSDSALLHDSLAAYEGTDDYAQAEAKSRSYSMAASSASVLLGGLLGSVELWLPYAFAAAIAVCAIWQASRFVEPPVDRTAAASVVGQGRAVAKRMRDPTLRWLLLWYVLAFTLAHITFEFYQPWIRVLGDSGSSLGEWLAGGSRAPVLSGVVMGLSMFGGMLGAMASLWVYRRMPLTRLLLLANLVQLLIVGALAVWLHPAALVLVFLRNFGMNMTHAPTMAAIAPRIDSSERATWLSLQSLSGRLGFSLVMFGLAGGLGDVVEWPVLSQALKTGALLGLLASLIVWWLGRNAITREEVHD